MKKVILICEVCLSRNYNISLKEDKKERFLLKKYCKICNKHTIHKESF